MRKKRYKGKEGFIYGESGNLPEWCDGNARELWYQSDRFERANGVTSRKIEFSLQTEIKDIELQKKLIRDVIKVASHGDGLPYSFAVHNSADGHNPHVHIMISERIPDDLHKTPEHYFKRYNGRNPKKGGCRKSPKLKTIDHVKEVRQAIADFTNKLFKLLNIDAHIDSRSYEEQGIDKVAGIHQGPQLREMKQRGVKSYALEEKRETQREFLKGSISHRVTLQAEEKKRIREMESEMGAIYRENLADFSGWKKLLKTEFKAELTPPVKKLYEDKSVTYFLLPGGYTIKVPSQKFPDYLRFSTSKHKFVECTSDDFQNASENGKRIITTVGGRNSYRVRTADNERMRENTIIEKTLLQKVFVNGESIPFGEILEACELEGAGETDGERAYECEVLEINNEDVYLASDGRIVRTHISDFKERADVLAGDRVILTVDRNGGMYLDDESDGRYLGR